MLRVLLAGVWPFVDGLQPHNAVQYAEVSGVLRFLAQSRSSRRRRTSLRRRVFSFSTWSSGPDIRVNVMMLLAPFAQRRLPPPPKSDESCGRVTPPSSGDPHSTTPKRVCVSLCHWLALSKQELRLKDDPNQTGTRPVMFERHERVKTEMARK